MASPLPPMPLLPITSPETIKKCKSLPLRPPDVFICSYPKSGTTWTQHIVLSLILADRRHRMQNDDNDNNGDGGNGVPGQQKQKNEKDLDYDHVSDFAPFFEIDAHWDPNDACLAESVRRNHDRLNQRVFNTHLRWEMLPKEIDSASTEEDAALTATTSENEKELLRPDCGKFIYVTRNLTDVCASFYHHLSNQKEGTYTEGFEAFASDWMAGKIPFGSPLHHLLSFANGFGDNQYKYANDMNSNQQQQKHEQPLLLLSYERMKTNLRQEVLRIIDFLNLDNIPTEVLEKEILPTFDFQSMKDNSHKFQPKSVTWLNGYQFLRRGMSGDGKSMFTETANIGDGTGTLLMDTFRDWVSKEEYCEQINTLVHDVGLDKEIAEQFCALVEDDV